MQENVVEAKARPEHDQAILGYDLRQHRALEVQQRLGGRHARPMAETVRRCSYGPGSWW